MGRESEHSRTDGDVPATQVAAWQQQRPRWDKSTGHEQGDQEAHRQPRHQTDPLPDFRIHETRSCGFPVKRRVVSRFVSGDVARSACMRGAFTQSEKGRLLNLVHARINERGATTMRDLTKSQFLAALKRNNMAYDYFGYVRVQADHPRQGGLHVYAGNAGPRLRDQLAYLIREQAKYLEREAQET